MGVIAHFEPGTRGGLPLSGHWSGGPRLWHLPGFDRIGAAQIWDTRIFLRYGGYFGEARARPGHRGPWILWRGAYAYEDIFRYLKTGLTDLGEEDRDLLENYDFEVGYQGEPLDADKGMDLAS